MAYELLIQNIERKVYLNDTDKKLITNFLKEKKIRKRHYLLQEGDMVQSLNFVVSGCLRSYAIDKNGVEHILQFAPCEWWITDMQALKYNQPSTLNIDAVEESTILQIRQTDLENLLDSVPTLDRYFRILAERSLATFQQRLMDALSLTAAERYTNFCKRYPSLIQNLPQKYVASYIGITPEFLSKMLSQPMKKH